jgi:Lar family restriction alleviation protein
MNKYLLKGMTGNFIIWKAEVEAISAEDAVCVEDYKGAQAIMVTRLLGKGELLPCPFCGETEKVMIDPDHDGPFPDDYTVRCWQCGVYGARRDNQSDAILAWNTRANLEHTEIAQDGEEIKA